jgi:hypothetical protein
MSEPHPAESPQEKPSVEVLYRTPPPIVRARVRVQPPLTGHIYRSHASTGGIPLEVRSDAASRIAPPHREDHPALGVAPGPEPPPELEDTQEPELEKESSLPAEPLILRQPDIPWPPFPEEKQFILDQVRPRNYFLHNGTPRRIETASLRGNHIIFYATAEARERVVLETLTNPENGWQPLLTADHRLTPAFEEILKQRSRADTQDTLVQTAAEFIASSQAEYAIDEIQAANLMMEMVVELQKRASDSQFTVATAFQKPHYTDIVSSPPNALTPADENKIHAVKAVVDAFDLDTSGRTAEDFFRKMSGAVGTLYDRLTPLVQQKTAEEMRAERPLPTEKLTGRRVPGATHRAAQVLSDDDIGMTSHVDEATLLEKLRKAKGDSENT